MTYKEALKDLRRVGCAHATGDAYRAMWARILPFVCHFQEHTAPKFYEYLKRFETDEDVRRAATEIHCNPLSACETDKGIL